MSGNGNGGGKFSTAKYPFFPPKLFVQIPFTFQKLSNFWNSSPYQNMFFFREIFFFSIPFTFFSNSGGSGNGGEFGNGGDRFSAAKYPLFSSKIVYLNGFYFSKMF